MAQKLKFGNGTWATKEGSTLAYNNENNNFKPLPFTTTRNSIGTRVNKEGLIEVVGNNIPRIDYTDSAKGVLLLENSATNLYVYSEKMSAWAYNFNAGTASLPIVTDNYTISPDGTQNASRAILNLNGGNSITDRCVLRVLLTATTALHTQSFYLKSNTTENYNVTFHFLGGHRDVFNVTPEWKRFTFTEAASTSVYTGIELRGTITSDYADIAVWGAQFEQNSIASSYIPTNGSSVTRQADTASGAGNSEVFNDSQGVLFAYTSIFSNDGTSRRISLTDGTISNRVSMEFDEIENTLKLFIDSSVLIANNLNLTNFSKISAKYKANDYALWVNGFEVVTSTTSSNVPSGLDRLNFDGGNSLSYFHGKTKEIAYYDTALTDAELETLTSYRSLSELVTELNLNTL